MYIYICGILLEYEWLNNYWNMNGNVYIYMYILPGKEPIKHISNVVKTNNFRSQLIIDARFCLVAGEGNIIRRYSRDWVVPSYIAIQG